MPNKLTQEEVVAKSVAVHGSGIKQVHIKTCTKCLQRLPLEAFYKSPKAKDGRDGTCSECRLSAKNKTGKRSKGRRTIADFIAEARVKHGETYGYELATYINQKAKVWIICPQHGPFKQAPVVHVSAGAGCPECGLARTISTTRHTIEQFIIKANKVHVSKYSYEQAAYVNTHAKLKILCPTHGTFWQTPAMHLSGQGCPKCKVERHRLGWLAQASGRSASLYLVRFLSSTEEFYKIGITLSSVKRRYNSKKYSAGYELEILALHTSHNAAAVYDWEQSILETFTHLKYVPKRRFYGSTECFSSCDEILAIFPVAG